MSCLFFFNIIFLPAFLFSATVRVAIQLTNTYQVQTHKGKPWILCLCSPSCITSHLLSHPPENHSPTFTFSCPQLASPLHLTGGDGHLQCCCFQGKKTVLGSCLPSGQGKEARMPLCVAALAPKRSSFQRHPHPCSATQSLPTPASCCLKVRLQHLKGKLLISSFTAPTKHRSVTWEALQMSPAQTISFLSGVDSSQRA